MERIYCLEIFIKKLHNLNPRVTKGCEEGVHIVFLDFPEITIIPQHPEMCNSVKRETFFTFNTCYVAEFLYTDDELRRSLPTQCSCRFKGLGNVRWNCVCEMTSNKISPAYATCVMKDQSTGETVGYVKMACHVFAKDMSKGRSRNLSEHELTASERVRSKPYILRVVVDRVGEKKTVRDPTEKESLSHVKNPSHRRQSGTHRVGKENTLLCTLKYNVAYQLQSINDFIARVLRDEHACLNRVQISRNFTDLEAGITKSVVYIIKLCNIILQITNQLSDGNTLGATSQLDGNADTMLKKNSASKLPVPTKGSVAHFAMYDVFFQLQCVGANLSYATLVNHKALEIPLDTLSKQVQQFCHELDRTIQVLNKQLNILIQSAVDDQLESTSFAPPTVNKEKSSADSSSNVYSNSGFCKSSSNQSTSLDKSSLRSATKSNKSSSESLSSKTTFTRVSEMPLQTQRTSTAAIAALTSLPGALLSAERQVSQPSDQFQPPVVNSMAQFKPFQMNGVNSYQKATPSENLATPSIAPAHDMNLSPLLTNELLQRRPNVYPEISTPTPQTQPSEPTNIPTLPPFTFPIASMAEPLAQKTTITALDSHVASVSPFPRTQIDEGLSPPNPSAILSLPVPVQTLLSESLPLPVGAPRPSSATLRASIKDSPHSDSSSTSIG